MRKILKLIMFVVVVMAFLIFGAMPGFCYVNLIDYGFELGLEAWESVGSLPVTISSDDSHSGIYSANLAGGPYSEADAQAMGKSILQLQSPLDLSGYSLLSASFWYNFCSYDATAYDRFSVDLKGSNGSNQNLL